MTLTDFLPDAAGSPSLAVLVDNARTALVASRDAGIEPLGFLVSEPDYHEIERTKGREQRLGLHLRVFGIDVHAKPGLPPGNVELLLAERP